MRLTLLAVVTVLTGCTTPEPPPVPRVTTSVEFPADEWDRRFDAAQRTPHPCGPATARSPECADWISAQADLVSALSAALRSREDSSRYSRTLAGIVKVLQSREAYTECGTDDTDCWRHAWQVNLASLALRTTLHDDHTR
ncbi:hypothetical protein SAMN05216553_112166 [Lentzea fradiae]|uniref:Lipoprotein n=2 Tax=Lentzea fradiae TaxID=200378 RepID=A0A1G7XQP4_9PSEU|nr:hypothetical protein SAMN05216553_112166 [Lentzea fradiae]